MVVGEAIHNIMGGIENTGSVKQHNHKKKLRQRFDIIKKLGQGTFGKVQLGINKETGQEVAIKTIKKSKIESEADLVRIRREIQIMSSVQHPNIIHIYEVFENREKMVLVMEYAAGGELYDYLSERKVLDEEEARRIFRQIATACYYCHKHKICHRDLKLENILLDENNNAKIADFGLSNVFDDQRLLNTFCGSPLYASPEIVKGTPYHGPEVDCWSLGVLLYTLVYGAMPFDGSNFKRLVKQISQGDYFEPAKPSRASPLIREMLTVNPKNRSDIEKICNHWWVNEGYSESCLVISEELANQTPVRLDVLLSLAPPPPQLESEKLMLTGDEESNKVDSIVPTRSQSVGSLMELTHPVERRIIDLINDEKTTPKRKLESTISTDRVNLDKRKDKIVKENTVADITVHGTVKENASDEDVIITESLPLDRCLTQTISKEKMDIETTNIASDPSLHGAACAELIEEAEKKKPVKVKRALSTSVSSKILEGINEAPSQENMAVHVDKENVEEVPQDKTKTEEIIETENKKSIKRKVANKKVLTDKNENLKDETEQPKLEEKPANETTGSKENKESEPETPPKLTERRKSRISEAAEKFQSLITPSESKPLLTEKPKKVIIPGVSVDGFKKEFERKASLTQTPTKPKSILTKKEPQENKVDETVSQTKLITEPVSEQKEVEKVQPLTNKTDEELKDRERVRNAVSIISSALDKEGTRKSKSRPCMMRKPPVPFGVSGRSASGNIGIVSPLSPPSGPKPFVRSIFNKDEENIQKPDDGSKTPVADMTMKSATLPRRKTSRAEITLKYPTPKPATLEFVTEMAHNVEAYQPPPTQRSEIIVPVSGSPNVGFRPNEAVKGSRERIIPIAFEKQEPTAQEKVQSPPVKPPVPKSFQSQMSSTSQTSNLSRQSTQDSDSDTIASTGEPIKKSDREYIIPIAVEGGGYVTPRAGSLEPNESSTSANRSRTKFGRARRLNTFFSDRDSEDESSPFSSLHRHGSIGRDSDNEDSKKDVFHMHRLRSTRPERSTLEHADSISSGEEDDDEGFEILTAENLFSTLLSRVRDLTQRLNVDDNIRPGFPSSRLLSHFDHGTNFWNRIEHPLTRHSSLGRTFSRDRPISKTSTGNSFGVPWRRSVTRDLPSDIDNVFQNSNNSTGQRPTGDDLSNEENLNLADLDLKKLKLSEEDALALSYLTPSLSRRIQKQLLSQLAPSEIKKLHRTLSASAPDEKEKEPRVSRRSVDRISSTLPRKYSVDGIRTYNNERNFKDETENSHDIKSPKSFLPIKKEDYRPSYEFSLRSSSIGAEPRGDSKFLHCRPKVGKTLVEPRNYFSPKSDIQSPESSLSESLSLSYRNNDSLDSSSRYMSDSSASRPCSKYSSDSYSRYVPSKSVESTPSVTSVDSNKVKKASTSSKRISRFLRPDFFEVPQEESVYAKEKKQREMETQKVLKEIRDKRKTRLNMRRERSGSREKQVERIKTSPSRHREGESKESDNLLNNVSNTIKNLEENTKTIHDYENTSALENSKSKRKTNPLIKTELSEPKTSTALHDYVNVKPPDKSEKSKKENTSRIARPKSYPTTEFTEKNQTSPEKESKISKLKKGFNRTSKDKTKDEKNETNKIINEEDKAHKNKLLQSIEKKLDKFRSSTTDKEIEEPTTSQEKKSTVESVIKRLREQSLPRNLEHCTESGLIKRAVSVEDLSTSSSTPLQASRKSVTKILGLFKKYEDQDNKRKTVKKTKTKDNSKNKPSHKVSTNKTDSANDNIKEDSTYIWNANVGGSPSESSKSEVVEKKERPRSLLFDKVRKFQSSYSSAKSDSVLNNNAKDSKTKSKLPINSFRRSLNLDTLPEPSKVYNNSKTNLNDNERRTDRKNLKLDFSKIPSKSETHITESLVSTTPGCEYNTNENRNSLTTTDDSSTMLSPSDDYMSCDSWSVCSELHPTNDLHSPLSPNGNHLYSGDENESVIDRIRRKSFYTRFNEKKRPRRHSSFRDSDLNYKTTGDYATLDRKSYDYRSPTNHRSSYSSLLQEPSKSYRPYTRSASLANDYVNVPNHYQMFSSKIGRTNSSLYGDLEGNDTLDDLLSTAKSKKYSSHIQPSRLGRTSVSPVNEYFDHASSSAFSPTNSEPI